MIKRFPLLAAVTPIILAATSSAMAQAPYPPPMPHLLANPCERLGDHWPSLWWPTVCTPSIVMMQSSD
jgi:hypothetical protein